MEEVINKQKTGFFNRRNRNRNQRKDRSMSLEERKSQEMHKVKIWLIKHLVLTGTIAFMSLVILYIYVVATTKDLNYLDALMSGLGSIFTALAAVFGV